MPAERIVALARRYATTRPAMIVLGGSSMHKGADSWTGARAIGCLPALTGNVGDPRRRLRPAPRQRHARPGPDQHRRSTSGGRPAAAIPNQMSSITEAMLDGRLRVMLLLGTDMLSSYAEAGRVAEGLARQDLVVSYDLFLNDTARRCADVVLPATAWLEELGCKSTNTHLYLMPKILEPPAETRPIVWVLRELAQRLGLDDFFPWSSDSGPLDAILDHPATGHATVAALAAEGGMRALNVSHVAHPDLKFPTPSGKIELVLRAGGGARPAAPARPRGAGGGDAVSAHAAPGTHAHALPRLLRPRPGAADAGQGRSGPRAVDLARRRRRARRDGRRRHPHPQRARRAARRGRW